jgi:hypothetical protein
MFSKARKATRHFGVVAVAAFTLIAGSGIAFAADSGPALVVTSPGPLTNATNYLTGLPSCGVGPVGVDAEVGFTLVTDYCNATTYRYDTSSGTPTLVASLASGLTHGIAVQNGVYFGVASNNQSIVAPGVWMFSPRTLELERQITQDPCGDIRGLANDPSTGDLILSGDCGMYRITKVGTLEPAMTPIASGNFDGLAIDPPTNSAWVALNGDDRINRYDLATGTLLASVAIAGGPDGIAIAAPDSPGGIGGNLFVNVNNGTIVMVDVHADNATSVVAAGGGRGDFVAVGADHFLYVTQPDSVVQIQPAIFAPPVTSIPSGLPIYGGTPIDVTTLDHQPTDGACTAGYAAKRVSTGALYMVTANHCRDSLNIFGTSTGRTLNPVYIYPAGQSRVPGAIPYASSVDCKSGDTSCLVTSVKPSDMFAWAPDTLIPTAKVLVGTSYQNVIGEANYKDLKNAGSVACWTGRTSKIEKCASIVGKSSELSAKQLAQIIKHGGSAALAQYRGGYVFMDGQTPLPGDSGSLVYGKTQTGVKAVGIVTATGRNTSISVMLPVQTIDTQLGLTTLTIP